MLGRQLDSLMPDGLLILGLVGPMGRCCSASRGPMGLRIGLIGSMAHQAQPHEAQCQLMWLLRGPMANRVGHLKAHWAFKMLTIETHWHEADYLMPIGHEADYLIPSGPIRCCH